MVPAQHPFLPDNMRTNYLAFLVYPLYGTVAGVAQDGKADVDIKDHND